MAALLAIGAGLFGIIWLAQRARELCVLSVRHGRTLLVRGRVPAGLRDALTDVLQRAQVQQATLRILRADGYARLQARGLDERTLQRARNVLGTYPLERILAARRPRSLNLGQRLGIAWLSWLLHERR